MLTRMEQWDLDVGGYLKEIEWYAHLCAARVRTLTSRPSWPTNAEDGLERLQASLERALADVQRARAEYQSKEVAR